MQVVRSLASIATAVWSLVALSARSVSIGAINGTTVPVNNPGYQVVDTRYHRGVEENNLQSGRRDVYVGAIGSAVAVPGTVRSIQYLSATLDKDATSNVIVPGTSFTDYTKVVIIPVSSNLVTGGDGGAYENVRWQVVGNANVTVHHSAPGGSAGASPGVAAAFAIELR